MELTQAKLDMVTGQNFPQSCCCPCGQHTSRLCHGATWYDDMDSLNAAHYNDVSLLLLYFLCSLRFGGPTMDRLCQESQGSEGHVMRWSLKSFPNSVDDAFWSWNL